MERKTALITGASSGLGAAFASRFAERGYNLILTGRREEVIQRKATKLKKDWGVDVDVFIIELSDENQVEKFINKIKNIDINVLINNAGFGIKDYFYQKDYDEWDKMLDVHIRCPMKLVYTVLPGMIKDKDGIIINVSSTSSFLPIPKNSIYSATKSFLKVFSETLNLDLQDSGVKVQALCPGFTKSDFHKKMGKDKSKQKDMGWMSAGDVVEISLKFLEKGKVVCIPGFWNKLMVLVLNLLPASIYNKMASNFGN